MRQLLKGLVRLYQLVFSPFSNGCCRFYPTCSQYALQALSTHHIPKALYLITKRLLRCNPWGGSGIDIVPESTKSKEAIKNSI